MVIVWLLIPNQLINYKHATFVAAVPAEDRAPTMASVQSKKQKKKKEKYSLSELKTMGHQLLSSRAHINNLPLLLSVVSPTSPPHYVLEAILSIQSFFTPVIRDLPSNSSKNFSHDAEDDTELIYRTWLRSKFDEFVRVLIDVLVSPESEDTLKEVVLDTVMELVKVGNRGRFHSAIYHRVLCSIVHSKFAVNMLLDLLVSKYFQFVDIRYFTYISVEKLAGMFKLDHISDERNTSLCGNEESHSSDGIELIHKLHYIISHIPPPESLDEKSHCSMWSESEFTLGSESKEVSENLKADHATEKHTTEMLSVSKISRKMKRKFSKAWISFLKLPLPVEVYKEVLVSLPQSVIPHLSKPVILCDFLTKSYDIGGVVSVMALSSLYVLMMQYGLEYPNFYEKLYALLVPSVFMAKHRARFFELLDSCLKSPLLPAYLAAAFAKKLSRLSLSAPPSGALVIIVLIHNLLRRHPSINCLVHQEVVQETVRDDSAEEETVASRVDDSDSNSDTSSWRPGVDYFISEESDPMKSRAMKSSLWEVDTLRHHHCPPVSRFVLSLEKDLTVRAKTSEIDVKDFCSGSYTTIFGEEMRKRVKQVPLAFYKTTPTTLFSESDFPGWSFKYEGSLANNNSNDINKVVEKPEENAEISAKRQRVECT